MCSLLLTTQRNPALASVLREEPDISIAVLGHQAKHMSRSQTTTLSHLGWRSSMWR